jgi:hypothetical protein
MPKCPECDKAMASVLKREAGQVHMYYECPVCASGAKKGKESAAGEGQCTETTPLPFSAEKSPK